MSRGWVILYGVLVGVALVTAIVGGYLRYEPSRDAVTRIVASPCQQDPEDRECARLRKQIVGVEPLSVPCTSLRRTARRMAKRIPILKRRIEAKRKSGADKATAWALDQVGTTESPPSSNRGPYPISHCQVFTIGYDGVAWCGCHVCSAAVEEGGADIPLKARLAYTPYIDQDAGNGANGLTEVSVFHALPGDIAVFNFGSGYAKHTGLVVGPTENGYVHCIEGNTSSGTSGSQDNGGGVYERKRPVSDVICIARPDYQG